MLKEKILAKIQSWSFHMVVDRINSICPIRDTNLLELYFYSSPKSTKGNRSVLRAILWKGDGLNTHGAKLDWKSVCTPREEGRLGFRLLTDWNKAVMMRHLWALCSKEDILWVKWVYMYIIKSQCLWQMPIPQDA